MKKLFLHVGCGKTGSSALQVWLSQVSDNLKAHGILYPMHNRKPLGDYTISSGNGTNLYRAVSKGYLNTYFRNLGLDDRFNTLMYSSEILQKLNEEQSTNLCKVAQENDFEIQIIAYVRDAYDITYSSYQQLVKRHTYTHRFDEFALGRENLQQFGVVSKLERWFPKVHVVHYDTIAEGDISLPVCNLIGIEPDAIPKMTRRKVNRSLTVYETELMRVANRIYMETHNKQSMKFSASLSDRLIAMEPELETQILFDQRVFEHLEAKMRPHIDRINDKYFGENRLRIFRKENKTLVYEVPELPTDFERFISVLIIPRLQQSNIEAPMERQAMKWVRKLFRK